MPTSSPEPSGPASLDAAAHASGAQGDEVFELATLCRAVCTQFAIGPELHS